MCVCVLTSSYSVMISSSDPIPELRTSKKENEILLARVNMAQVTTNQPTPRSPFFILAFLLELLKYSFDFGWFTHSPPIWGGGTGGAWLPFAFDANLAYVNIIIKPHASTTSEALVFQYDASICV